MRLAGTVDSKEQRGFPYIESQARTLSLYYELIRLIASNGKIRSISLALYRLLAAAYHERVT